MSEAQRRSGKVHALIVDDSPGFRRELRVLLELEEVVVVGEAANGWEAIELTEQLEPDVILMDQNMPALSGVGATRKIKNQHPQRRVIFVAAEGEWRDEAFRAGADAYFVKGSNLDGLMRAIHDPLAGLRSRALPSPARPTEEAGRTLAIAAAGVLVFGLLGGLILAPSVALPGIALLFGFFFFLYGLKYYGTNALILLATSGNGNGNGHANGGLIGRLRNGNGNGNGKQNGSRLQGLGLNNGGNGRLHVQPFVSIHLPLYNEKSVVDRLLTACTTLDYENYEVIVADDSTDETTQLLMERWEPHPRVKLSHRADRSGFKGGALQKALEVTDPRSEFVAVFDADFLPPPDIIHQFLAYFYGVNGNGNGQHGGGEDVEEEDLRLIDDRVAVVQGYQWHILNASENWITKGIRSEFSGSYVVERAGQELLGSMKMISGSVFMIRTDVLRTHGWGTSITEDWELTLRLYLEGYKVLYTPFIQAPSECVASFKQLARQRMRWAEGHTFNVKKYCWDILNSEKLSWTEKLEFIYYIPYYLQSVLFMLGTSAWMLSELIFRFQLPMWTETLGWALVFANAGSLVLMNLTGLFLERGIQRSWTGLFSFVLLTYLLIPYQAWAAIKGLFEPHEGGWHRTQKTGVITEAVDRMQLKKRMRKLLPKKKRKGRGSSKPSPAAALWNRLPARLRRLPRRSGPGFQLASSMLTGLVILGLLASNVTVATAAPDAYYLHADPTTGITPAGEYVNSSAGSGAATLVFDTAGQNEYWYTDLTYPTGNDDASIAAGTYTLHMYFSALPASNTAVSDSFTESSNTALTAHTPDTGTGWSEVYDNSTATTDATIDAAQDIVQGGSDENNVGQAYTAAPAPSRANQALRFTLSEIDTTSGTKPVGLFGRRTDNSNFYHLQVLPNDNGEASLKLFKYEGGVATELGSIDATIAAGDTFILELTDAVKRVYHNGSVVISSTDNALTSIGTWGLYFGDFNGAGDGGHLRDTWDVDDFRADTVAIVDITVTASHTAGDGSSPVTIVSNSTTITANTPDPLAFDLGSGAAQTFTAADPQRLRAQIAVDAVAHSGSFSLAYDSAADPSNLETPVVTVPDPKLLLLASAIFFPLLTGALARPRRLATRLISVGVSLVLAITVLSTSVAPAVAAPDTFYLHQTASGSTTLSTDFGTFTANLGTGNQSVTGVGFEPEAILFWITDRTGTGNGQFARFGRGWTDGTNQGAVATAWDDEPVSANSNDSRSRVVDDKSISLITHTGTILAEAEIVSMDADGFTINWTTGGGFRVVSYLAIGGEALTNVKAGGILWSTGTTFAETGVGFQPDALLLAGVENTAVFGTSDQGGHGFGVALSPTDRHSDSHRWRDQKTDANSGSSGLDSRYALVLADDTNTPDQAYDLQSMDSDGFTLDLAVGVSGDQVAMVYLALQGPSIARGVITQPTATGTQSVTGLSFQPDVVLFDGGDKATVDGFEQDAEMVAGVATGGVGEQAGFWIGAENSTSPWPSDTSLSTSRVITSYVAGTPTLEADARMNSLNADGFTIEWMTADATQRKIGWIALGGTSISPTGEFMDRLEGSSATTKTFDTVGQNAYWYVDEIWPTGDGDGGIASGAYTFNMYFGSLPSGGTGVAHEESVTAGAEAVTTLTTPNLQPGTDQLYIVAFDADFDRAVSSVSGGGLTWSLAKEGCGSRSHGNQTKLWTYYAVGSPGSAFGVTVEIDGASNLVAIASRYSGADPSTPIEDPTFENTNGENDTTCTGGTDNDSPLLTTGSTLADSIHYVATYTRNDTFLDADDYAERATVVTGTSGATRRIYVHDKLKAATGDDTANFTLDDTTDWITNGFVIRPASTASVDITVSVHHTKPDGSDPQLITSASTTITDSTSDPLAFSLGSGAAQTFTSADPRRLRLHVTVDSISNGGSFVLDYDDSCASNSCSNLDTPVVTVPDYGMAFLLLAPLVPYLMSYLWKRRRRAAQLMSVLLAVSVTLGMLAQDVDSVTAAPDTFYFHDTNTTGITPAGKYMDNTEGSAGSTMTFDTAGQDAYWYNDVTWPTGNDDASIAAGSYTANLYFNQLPSTQAPAIDAVSSDTTGARSMTIPHTTSGSDRLMLVGVSINNENFETVDSVTYNGVALSLVGSAAEADDARVEIWSLVAPDVGTHDVVITFSAQLSRDAVAGVMTFTGVDQTTPLGTFASANGSSAGPATVDVSSAADQLVFDTVGCETCGSLTAEAGQTERWNGTASRGAVIGAGSTEPGASTVTMSWSLGSSDHWAIGAVPILPATASVAPAVDATSSDTTSPGSLTIAHTTSGSQRLMLVGVSMNNDGSETVDSVTYNGTALSLVGSVAEADDARVEIWSLTGPDIGTHDVVITFSAELQQSALAGVMTFTGVDQTTPLGTFASAHGSSAGPATVDVSSAANELVFDTVACETCGSLTAEAGQTEHWNLSQGRSRVIGAGSTEPGAGTVTMSWTLGSSDKWAIGAVPIKPAAPEVSITAYVHHTASDGSGASLITSASTTITSATSDPLALDLGSAAQQTFTSADPRRLRAWIEVTAVSGAGSFVLDYDGACASNLCSNLDTPVVTVPEFGIALLPVALLLPALAGRVIRRRKLLAEGVGPGRADNQHASDRLGQFQRRKGETHAK